ncbi:MAG: hypothetical protein R2911_26405 [Caldilineaceae bacterium]
MHFGIQKGFFRRTVGHAKAVDDVSFAIQAGETLGIGGGERLRKTTAGRCIVRAYRPPMASFFIKRPPTCGSGAPAQQPVADLSPADPHDFPDPFASLNPSMTVLDIAA